MLCFDLICRFKLSTREMFAHSEHSLVSNALSSVYEAIFSHSACGPNSILGLTLRWSYLGYLLSHFNLSLI